jgi:hypothetical protein
MASEYTRIMNEHLRCTWISCGRGLKIIKMNVILEFHEKEAIWFKVTADTMSSARSASKIKELQTG